jgi:hypothetical protein
VSMPGDEDWVMRPAIEGLCKYESLLDGTLHLGDIVRMNAALDVKAENDARAYKAEKDRRS